MRFHLLAVGKLKPAFRESCDEYLHRLAHYATVEEREVREAGRADSVTLQRETEGKRLLDAIPDGATTLLLDQDGEGWSSEELARQFARWQLDGRDRAVIIGGAVGVSEAVRRRADSCWSLGPLTLPHQLVRVIVLEQLYRAATILRGEPYHKGAR